MKSWNSIALGIGVTLLLGAGMWGCGSGSAQAPDAQAADIHTTEAARGTLTRTASAFGSIAMPHQANLSFGSAGNVAEVDVEFGDPVNEGDVLAALDTGSLERAVRRAEADLRTAQIGLEQANSEAMMSAAQAAVESAQAALAVDEDSLEDAQTPYSDSDIANAEAAVRNAQVDLKNAQLSLRVARTNGDIAIDDARTQLSDARDTYYDFVAEHTGESTVSYISDQKDDLWDDVTRAQQNLDAVTQETEKSVATAENNVLKAEDALRNARDDLADMTPDPIVIQQKESAVATARANLYQAEADLANVKAGLDIEALQLAIDKAQIAVDDARAKLEDATITAPFDGVIAEVNVKVGDGVTANTVAIKLVDVGTVEVDGQVDEIDIDDVKVGQQARISVDALPHAHLTGEVIAISPLARKQSGLVTYQLTVRINNADEANLKEGMTASVDIEAVLAEDAILLPGRAIKKVGAAEVVYVIAAGGQVEQRTVKAGASDGTFTEVVSGVKAGESVITNPDKVDITVLPVVPTESGTESGMPEDVAECLASLEEQRGCFEKLAQMAQSMGMDPGAYSGDIDWKQLEHFANDDSGMIPKDIQGCMKGLLKNRECIEKLMKMAKDMGIDPGDFSLDNWEKMGNFGGK